MNRIFCALDTPSLDRALDLGRRLKGAVGGLKLGLEFFTANGPDGVRAVAALGLPIFLDLKLHDIPNTVAGAVRALRGLGLAFLNVHASGGRAMLEAARDAAGDDGMKLLGVTVLTSLDTADLAAIGQDTAMEAQVLRLGRLSRAAGLAGVVASSREVTALRQALGPEAILMIPGIRPDEAASGDQKRTMTPADAIAAGADYVVVGRPITTAADPAAAAGAIAATLGAVA